MNLERIGTYKGYDVFAVGRYDIDERECVRDTMYIIKETGSVILNGEVVAKADLNKMSVDELPKSQRTKYFAKREIAKPSVSREKPEYSSRGNRAKTQVYDDAAFIGAAEPKVQTAEINNLFAGMDMIDKYIESALAAVLVEAFEAPTYEN